MIFSESSEKEQLRILKKLRNKLEKQEETQIKKQNPILKNDEEVICEIDIASPPQEITVFMILLKRMKKKNNLDFCLKIMIDYSMPGMGVYFRSKKGMIFINPENCINIEDISNINDKVDFWNGYVKDLTLFGVTIHEFCHYASEEVFSGMINDYRKTFPTKRLRLNDYSNNSIDDEIAETMTLYITNPLFLKLISKEHWDFFKKYFTSPVPTSHKQSYDIYEKFPPIIKERLKNDWNIDYNILTNKFFKLENIKDG